jgi:hypothetical protein
MGVGVVVGGVYAGGGLIELKTVVMTMKQQMPAKRIAAILTILDFFFVGRLLEGLTTFCCGLSFGGRYSIDPCFDQVK